jgi:hypothetical protein
MLTRFTLLMLMRQTTLLSAIEAALVKHHSTVLNSTA